MCGICGFYGIEDKNLLKDMCSILSYRGPDDSGFFIDENVSLGHRRLSIIDISGGHQPIHNEDESIFVVLNGEIFNFKELRSDLIKRGHRFYTNSDTEVIVHLYEDDDKNFIEKIRGMFAFALWDSKNKRLIIARDRAGINPLYYTTIDKKLLFASEIKSLLQYKGIEKEINYPGLSDYLIFGAAIGPNTLFKDINELLPGHMILCSGKGITIKKYWDLKNFASENLSEDYYVKKLMEKLKETVEKHLVSDVPVGMYLSGGVDSSTILALMNTFYNGKIQTFSAGFGHTVDELAYAKEVSEFLGTDHSEFIIEPGKIIKDIYKTVWHLEDPFGDFGIFWVYHLSNELKKKNIKVVLSGGGSDELFGGYWGHRYIPYCYRLKNKIPNFIRTNVMPPIIKFIPLNFPPGFKTSVRFKKYLRHISGRDFYKGNGGIFPVEDERRFLYNDDFYKLSENANNSKLVKDYFDYNNIPDSKLLTKTQYVDFKVYVDAHLLHVDKMTMAHGVELRHPFLDYELAEFSFSIPESLRIKDSVEKYILRKTMSKYPLLPKNITERKKKGFLSPIEDWLSGEFRDFTYSKLNESEIVKNIMNERKLNFLLKNSSDHWFANKVWGLLILALWYEIYFENPKDKI